MGDYTLPKDQSVCIDSKKGLTEVCNNVCTGDHSRFREDCVNAIKVGIRYIVLIEEDSIGDNGQTIDALSDVQHWINPRLKKSPTATKGITLMKAMQTMKRKYGVQFIFCRSKDAGEIIAKILRLET